MDVNFDDIPEIVLYNSAGSAADFVYFYDLNGLNIGSFGIPSMNVEYNCVENNGKELFMISAKSLNYHPQNGEEGPTEYHFISVMDFDNGEEHHYSSTIVYEMIHLRILFRQQFIPMMLKLKAQLQLMKLRSIMIVLWLITM